LNLSMEASIEIKFQMIQPNIIQIILHVLFR